MAESYLWLLTPTDAVEASRVLASAFDDEPIFIAAAPDATVRDRFNAPLFAYDIRRACLFGEAWAVGVEPGIIAGAAFWVTEPSPHDTPDLEARFELPYLDPAAATAAKRLREYTEQGAASLHAALLDGWRYLDVIGIAPEHRGKGLGTSLLRRILDDAADAGVPVGLMTDRPGNRPFFERAGMELIWQGTSDDGKVPFWAFRTP